MKKILIGLLITAATFLTLVFTIGTLTFNKNEGFKVAMVTDFSDVNDASFNQACYEGGKEWCKNNRITFNYYKPSSLSLAERIKSMKLAIDRGYDVILCPGYALGEAIAEVAPKHPNVKFIGLDISQFDFPQGFTLPENVVVYNYHEEVAGYLAGYAAVKDGYRKLGFLGGMEAAAVIRFGYGYVQGVNAAAEEIKEPVDLNYVYGGQFFGDSEIFKYIDNWYKVDHTEIVFACGGSIYTSVALAAKENNGKMIGVDSDQSPIIDRDYGQDICITSAMKGIRQTVVSKLEELYNEHIWQGGKIEYLGLNSKVDPDENYVQLAPSTWELGKERMTKFTLEDYQELVGYLIDNPDAVSSDIDHEPALGSYLKVSYKGTIK